MIDLCCHHHSRFTPGEIIHLLQQDPRLSILLFEPFPSTSAHYHPLATVTVTWAAAKYEIHAPQVVSLLVRTRTLFIAA